MDVVYLVKASQRNEELRYSLRSLRNVSHDRVWMAGHRPSWVSEKVGHVPTNERPGSKWASLPLAMEAACRHPELAAELLLMNDDFFIMEPFAEIPVMHRGPLERVKGYGAKATYPHGMAETQELLRSLGFAGQLLSYELHAPMPIVTADMAEILARVRGQARCLHYRTLYGNAYAVGGQQVDDCKFYGQGAGHIGRPLISTTDSAFASNAVGRYIREAFPTSCAYER